jgi:hypothetical protein
MEWLGAEISRTVTFHTPGGPFLLTSIEEVNQVENILVGKGRSLLPPLPGANPSSGEITVDLGDVSWDLKSEE